MHDAVPEHRLRLERLRHRFEKCAADLGRERLRCV